MKHHFAFLAACLLATPSLAEKPAERLEGLSAQTLILFDNKDYGKALTAYEAITADSDFAGLQNTPGLYYRLARAAAQVGKKDKALAALTKAVDLGGAPRASEVEKEADLASLREEPRFKALAERLRQEEALWQDNPALATPYKPVLSEEEKAAGVSKLWAEARFNFAFFGRLNDLDWDAAYMDALKEAHAARTTEEYYRGLMRFLAKLKDGHTRVLPPAKLMDHFNGVTSVNTRLVEGKIIVTGTGDPALKAQGVVTGAEVTAIDGQPALAYAKTKVAPYVFGFTPQDRAVWTYDYKLLRGPVAEPVRLTLRHADGTTGTVTLPRHQNKGVFGVLPEIDLTAHFKLLPGNIAYLQVNIFANDSGAKTMQKHFAAISKAKGLIIDIRNNSGGSSENGYALMKLLTGKPFKDSNWRSRDYKPVYRSWYRTPGWLRVPADVIKADAPQHYTGPVAVLTSPRTFSAAEDFLVVFASAKRGKLVGETTAGSTGNPLLIKLPGGGMAFICTKDDSFPDGRVFEGVGIAPDVPVAQTIADIRAGRDAVLEKAVEVLKKAQ